MDQKNKIIENLVTSFFVIFNLILFKFFVVENYFEEILTLVTFFVVTPFLYNKFILKRNISTIGIQKGDFKKGLFWSFYSLILAILIFYIILKYTYFLNNYKIPIKASNDFFYFIYYEFVFLLFLNFIYEIFFRGFFMLYLKDRIGYFSIVIQWFLFLILIYFNHNFNWTFLPFIVFSFFSGLITYKSCSIWYAIVTQVLFIFFVDVIFIKFLL